MEPFLIRLLIGIAIIWLTQFLLSTFGIAEPANKLILVIVALVVILFIAFGYTYLPR